MSRTESSQTGPATVGTRDPDEILSAAFDGTLDAAGHVAFAELLRTDPKFRARWAQTAQALSRLRNEPPPVASARAADRTDQILARVGSVRQFRTLPPERSTARVPLALAACLGLTALGVLAYTRLNPEAQPAQAPASGPAPLAAAPAHDPTTTAVQAQRPGTPPTLSLSGTERYERGNNFGVVTHVESPSTGRTSARIVSLANGKVLLTDFEPYPLAQSWGQETAADRSWWLRAWTQADPRAWEAVRPHDDARR